ncbi:MAG: zinc ribbon domain-containing protein, partial [Myxococcales bacterium]|nr:zinc ribbon domain-containing protein [Myxococcales bacterium]
MATHTCPQCGSSLPAQARFCGQCGFSMPAGAPPPAPAPAPAAPPPAAQKPLARTMALGSPAFPDASPVTSPSPHRHQEGPVERPAPPLMNDEETVRRD